MGMEQRRSSRDTCGKGVIMIRVNQLKLPIEHSEEMLRRQIIKTLHLKNEKNLIRYQIPKANPLMQEEKMNFPLYTQWMWN